MHRDVCSPMHIYRCTCTHPHRHVDPGVRVRTHTERHMDLGVRMHTHTHTHVDKPTQAPIDIYVSLYGHTHVDKYACIHLYE